MTISEFKAKMMGKQLSPIYIFVGTEVAIRDIYIKQIAKIYRYDIKYLEDASDAIKSARKMGIMQKPTLFVISECNDILKNEKAWKLFDMDLGQNMLLLLFTSIDKRIKFYSQYKSMMVEFEPLSPEMLKKYIKREIELSDKNCETLIEICEGNYGRCLLEIDKMKTYVKAFNNKSGFTGYTPEDCFYYFIQSGTLYRPPKDAIFDFVDAVLRRDAKKSFKLMMESYDSGEATLVMISNLYSNFKALLQVQSCKSRDISNCTGLTSWQIKNMKQYQGNYAIGELVEILAKVREAEISIKTGTMDEMVAIPHLLINIL